MSGTYKNRNMTFKWWENHMSNKILIAKDIIDCKNPVRCFYGIFVKNKEESYCAYIGRANNIYKRLFSGPKGHLVNIKKGTCKNEKLRRALKDDGSIIEIKIIEIINCQYDNYYKDMQRLAFAEYYYISKYQELNQCLEQLPDGSNMNKSVWDDESEKYLNK